MTIREFLKALKKAPNGWSINRDKTHFEGHLTQHYATIRNSKGSCPIVALTSNEPSDNGHYWFLGEQLGLHPLDIRRIVSAADGNAFRWEDKLLRLRMKWALGIPLWK